MRPIVAWQGWRLRLPPRWGPLKLEGDWREGYALFADTGRPKLGVRWTTLKAKAAEGAIEKRFGQELGVLAAQATRAYSPPGLWLHGRLYTDPSPPGRDVWLGYSPASGRMLELVYQVRRRDGAMAGALLPSLGDESENPLLPWSIFDFSCQVSNPMPLSEQRLNAGDITLGFGDRRRGVTMRQISVASVALRRMPLDQWLAAQMRLRKRNYRPAGLLREGSLAVALGRFSGLEGQLRRRRRFGFMRWIAPRLWAAAAHDPQRDRLYLVEATDEQLLRQTAATIGWAQKVGASDVLV